VTRRLFLLSVLLVACGHKNTVNPNIILPGAPRNGEKSASSSPGTSGAPNSDLVFLSSDSINVPANTELSVKLTDPIDASQNKSGDTFNATLAKALIIGTKLVVSEGASLRGQLTDVLASQDAKSAELSLTMVEIMINSRWFPLQTNLLTIQADETGSDSLNLVNAAPPVSQGDPVSSQIVHIRGNSVRLPSGQVIIFRLTQKTTLETPL
jgi:hypothetical protein